MGLRKQKQERHLNCQFLIKCQCQTLKRIRELWIPYLNLTRAAMFEERKKDCMWYIYLPFKLCDPVSTDQYLIYGSVFVLGNDEEVLSLPHEQLAKPWHGLAVAQASRHVRDRMSSPWPASSQLSCIWGSDTCWERASFLTAVATNKGEMASYSLRNAKE